MSKLLGYSGGNTCPSASKDEKAPLVQVRPYTALERFQYDLDRAWRGKWGSRPGHNKRRPKVFTDVKDLSR